MPDPHVVGLLVAALMAAGAVLWYVPHPCRCPHCTHHVRLHQEEEEHKRAERHRRLHWEWGIPWGWRGCGQCQSGYRSDERK